MSLRIYNSLTNEMNQDGFWNDQKNANKIIEKLNAVKEKANLMDEVSNAYQDVLDAFELYELDENEETMSLLEELIISFEKLGLSFTLNRTAFSLFGIDRRCGRRC